MFVRCQYLEIYLKFVVSDVILMPTSNVAKEDIVYLQALKLYEHIFLNKQAFYNPVMKKQV